MNATSLVWIIVGIVVVIIIVGLIVYVVRKRNQEHLQKQRAADKNQAADLRQNAQNVELDARENEAKASRARADAEQAEVNAERLRRESTQRGAAAQDQRVDSDEQAMQAETLDPSVSDARYRADHASTSPRPEQADPGGNYPQADITGGRDH